MKRVLFRPQAARDLEGLPNRSRDQVEQAIERFAQTGAGDIKMLAGEGRSGCASETVELVSCMRSRTSFGFCTFATAAKHTVEAGTLIEAAHTNALGRRGMGQKTSDFSAIPLCSGHHRESPDSYHRLGEQGFLHKHGISLKELVLRLQSRF